MLTLSPPKESKQILKTFLIADFFYWPLVSLTPVANRKNLRCEYFRELSKKNSKRPYWDTQGLGGKRFMKKHEVENLLALTL
jgi:hypothetical protein